MFVHILLGARVRYYIVHKVLVSKGKGAGMYSPYICLIIHQINSMDCVFFVHTIHQSNATLFKQPEKSSFFKGYNIGCTIHVIHLNLILFCLILSYPASCSQLDSSINFRVFLRNENLC